MKNLKKRGALLKIFCVAVCLCMCIGLCACDKTQPEPLPENPDEQRPLIGLSMDSLLSERWERDRDVFVSSAERLGAQVIVQTANDDSDEQIRQIEYLIEKNVDVLVVIPNRVYALSDVLKKAKDKGIKIVAYDRLIQNAPIDLYISFDNVKVGSIMAQELVKKVPEGNYVIINGSRDDYNATLLKQGYDGVLNARPKINVISEHYTENWMPEDAVEFFSKVLESGEKIDAVLCGSDMIAGPVIKLLAERQLADDVAVAAQDAELTACQRIVQGAQTVTVYKNITMLAQKAAEFSVMLATGDLPAMKDKMNNQWGDIPFYKITPQAVTKETMVQTVIEDGFHRKEDVYANVPQSEWPD